jgi:uncharacterized membrane protein YhaH (DUF805 family)
MSPTILTLAENTGGGGVLGAITGLVMFVIWLAVIVATLAGFWKTFQKAGHPGWAALIPIYNLYILTQICGRPWWLLIGMFIPFLNFAVLIFLCVDVARVFGKSPLFAVGLAFLAPVFFCLLGFGDAKYLGPAAGTPILPQLSARSATAPTAA